MNIGHGLVGGGKWENVCEGMRSQKKLNCDEVGRYGGKGRQYFTITREEVVVRAAATYLRGRKEENTR